MDIVDWKDKLTTAANGNMNKRVVLTHKEKTSVFTHTGEGTDMALKELGSYFTLAETVAVQPFTSRGACNVIDGLRAESLMDGYYRGSGEFSDHVAEFSVTVVPAPCLYQIRTKCTVVTGFMSNCPRNVRRTARRTASLTAASSANLRGGRERTALIAASRAASTTGSLS